MSSSKATSSSLLHIEAERLKTFTAARPGKTRWPHAATFSVTPESLAANGFYYNPSGEADDSARCFLCEKQLGGWEEGDLALEQHLSHTKNGCPFAVLRAVQLARDIDEDWYGVDANSWLRDMHSEDAIALRRRTFEAKGYKWPHDRKKGWLPTSANLAAAGFSLQLLRPDDDDTATCVYCGLYLSGWEKTDDPREEHRRRQLAKPCPFFVHAPKDGDFDMPVEVASQATSAAGLSKKKRGTSRKTPVRQSSAAAASETEVESQPARKRRTRGGGRSAAPSEDEEPMIDSVATAPLRQSRRGATSAARITKTASNDTLAESTRATKAARKPRAKKSKRSQEGEEAELAPAADATEVVAPTVTTAEPMAVDDGGEYLHDSALNTSALLEKRKSNTEEIPPKSKKRKGKSESVIDTRVESMTQEVDSVKAMERRTPGSGNNGSLHASRIENLIDLEINEELLAPLMVPSFMETVDHVGNHISKPTLPQQAVDHHGLTDAERALTVREWEQREADKARSRLHIRANERLRAFDEKAATVRQTLVDLLQGGQVA